MTTSMLTMLVGLSRGQLSEHAKDRPITTLMRHLIDEPFGDYPYHAVIDEESGNWQFVLEGVKYQVGPAGFFTMRKAARGTDIFKIELSGFRYRERRAHLAAVVAALESIRSERSK